MLTTSVRCFSISLLPACGECRSVGVEESNAAQSRSTCFLRGKNRVEEHHWCVPAMYTVVPYLEYSMILLFGRRKIILHVS